MEKLKVLFIDNRMTEIRRQLKESGVSDEYEILPLKKIDHMTVYQVSENEPDVIVIGFGLGQFHREYQDGADIIKYLKRKHYRGRFIANTGGGVRLFAQKGAVVDASANRSGEGLRNALRDVANQIRLINDPSATIESGNAQMLLDSKPMDYELLERKIISLLNKGEVTPELELLLEAFLQSRQNYIPVHGRWVHALSHFSDELWGLRMTSWIARFNEAAFRGAIELGDTNCSDRLLSNFYSYAQWNDDPADFNITGENLSWADWTGWYLRVKRRIEASPFESEAAFLLWKSQQSED